jgi:hypothetical protein
MVSARVINGSKNDEASTASSINSTLQRIKKRLDSIERLNLGLRLSVIASSLKKPVDTTPYNNDDSDDSLAKQ